MQQKQRLVLLPCPYQGHLTPMLHLGAVLHSHGFSIAITHPSTINVPYPHPNYFQFLPIPDGFSDQDIRASATDFMSAILKLNVNCKTPLKDSLQRLSAECEGRGEKLACLVFDGVMCFAEEVARELELPFMVFRTFCANHLRVYNEYPRLREQGYIPLNLPEPELLELVPGLHPLRFKDLPIYKFKQHAGLISINQKSKTSYAAAVIINTTDALDQQPLLDLQSQHNMPVLAVGPLHKISPPFSTSLLEEDATCITWLATQEKRSVLYVSMGSLTCIDPTELVEMAWGLANSKQPFLWVIRPGSVRGSEWTDATRKLGEMLPEGLIQDKGLIIKWAPQREVLAHESIGGFWSHCGWNSTLESIGEGVPMICTPAFLDQRVNARCISHVWRIGVVVEVMERKEIQKAVEKVMVSEEGEMLRQRAKELKEKVEDSIVEGGSSYNYMHKLVNIIQSFDC